MSGMRRAERLTLSCVDLDDEGAGLSGGDPRLHVAGALPGERVTAVVEHVSVQRPDAWARLERVDAPSPQRRVPACPAFGACGGCVLQHLDYGAQLAWKTARVRRLLPGVRVPDCVASPRTLGYRNRSKLVAARGRDRRLVLGAYGPRSHAVVDTAGCRIAEAPLDDVAQATRHLLDAAGVAPYDERTLAGDLRYVVLRANSAGEVLAVWVAARAALPDGEALARELMAARPEVLGVVEHVNRSRGNVIFGPSGDRLLAGTGTLDEQAGAIRFRLSARAFFQVNREVAVLAYAAIARALAARPADRIVDTYAGVGGIALTLAPAAGEVIGIEEEPTAAATAGVSAALSGIGNAHFVAGDAAAELARIDHADLVVLNPPRKGCEPAVIAEVTRLGPRAIAYLSCDLDSLARDLAAFAARGYATESVTPFDMLPHTPHVEALAVLKR
jgi:23S rRNA (uracil1939-C5)-methyltransferase